MNLEIKNAGLLGESGVCDRVLRFLLVDKIVWWADPGMYFNYKLILYMQCGLIPSK